MYMSDNCYNKLGFMTFEKPIAESENVINSDTTIVLRDGSTHLGQLWTGDSGCSCSTTNDLSGMYDVESIDENVVGFGGQKVHATKKGKMNFFVRKKDGRTTKRLLQLVKYCPNGTDLLISITAEMEKRGSSFLAMQRIILS